MCVFKISVVQKENCCFSIFVSVKLIALPPYFRISKGFAFPSLWQKKLLLFGLFFVMFFLNWFIAFVEYFTSYYYMYYDSKSCCSFFLLKAIAKSKKIHCLCDKESREEKKQSNSPINETKKIMSNNFIESNREI